MVEDVPGEYRPNLSQDCLIIENKEVYSRAPGYISDVAMFHGEAQKLYLIYNVTEKDFKIIVDKIYKTYSECEEIARNSNGNIVLASTFVTTKVLGE